MIYKFIMGKPRKTTKKFIEEAQTIFGDLYDYSQCDYKGCFENVNIVCREHGVFQMMANSHLRGCGCQKCARRIINKSITKSATYFIEKAELVHGDKFDYSLVDYKSMMTKTIIVCKIHGEFLQRPHDHLSGYGCPGCKSDSIRQLLALTYEEFVERACRIHEDRYDYSKVLYLTSQIKIEIICKKHGSFWQNPSNHLQGAGCPKCISIVSKPEIEWLDDLNVLEIHRHKSIKIDEKKFNVDAYNPITNTVYEFYGDFWHGNPKKFPAEDMHPIKHCTYGECHDNTLRRENVIKSAGYSLITIWEQDFKNLK